MNFENNSSYSDTEIHIRDTEFIDKRRPMRNELFIAIGGSDRILRANKDYGDGSQLWCIVRRKPRNNI